jgi:hypothetical protein
MKEKHWKSVKLLSCSAESCKKSQRKAQPPTANSSKKRNPIRVKFSINTRTIIISRFSNLINQVPGGAKRLNANTYRGLKRRKRTIYESNYFFLNPPGCKGIRKKDSGP